MGVVFLTGMIAGCADYRSTRGKSDTLGEYEIGILPHLREFRRIGKRPDEPFVMVNMLIYKNRAKGADFEGLSGAEAYQLYFDGLAGAQSEIGSRLIWAGRVQTQFVGNSDPVFETIALLEYAGPKTFTAFAKKPGDAPKARTAGLLGQWLIASTTLEEAQSSIELDSPDESPFDQADLKKTGLTASQIERLREGPADEPLFIFDLLRFTDASGERYRPYREALSVATTLHGGMVLWRGSVDSLVIGKSSPSFHEIAVTQYPDRVAYLSALSDPDVVAVAESWTNGLALRWSFTASEKTDWGLAGSELGATG